MKTQYYKYRTLYQFEGGVKVPNKNTQSIFQKGEIFYSAPKNFNDPYDCNLKLHVDDSTDAEWEEYCDKLTANYPMQAAAMALVKAGRLWRTDPTLSQGLGDDLLREHYEKSSVFCLSKKGNSIPMFSYYCDSHQGIAIEFTFSDEDVPCGFPFGDPSKPETLYGGHKIVFRDVEYANAFPELNYHRIGGDDRLTRHLIFTKHHEWANEDEFRIFRRKVPPSAVKFEKRLLTRVVFGCKTGLDDVNIVRSWLAGWPSDVVFAKAEMATNRFDLEIRDFDLVKGILSP